jgi:hypothetical protein
VTQNSTSSSAGSKQAWLRTKGLGLALLLGAGCFFPACETEPGENCSFEGEPALTLTPRKGEGALDGEVTDLPAFAAPQGVPASEVDFLLTGLDSEDITTIRVTVVADSVGTISDTTYSSQSIGFACLDEGGLFVQSLPVAYVFPIAVVEDLTDLTGTLNVDISGATPFNESYPVELRVTSY